MMQGIESLLELLDWYRKRVCNMNLYDELIKEILGQLNRIAKSKDAKMTLPSKPWKDVGEHHMILGREAAYELGGGSMPGLSGCLYTTSPILLEEGVYLYGKDLTQIRENQPYARIVLAELEQMRKRRCTANFEKLIMCGIIFIQRAIWQGYRL